MDNVPMIALRVFSGPEGAKGGQRRGRVEREAMFYTTEARASYLEGRGMARKVEEDTTTSTPELEQTQDLDPITPPNDGEPEQNLDPTPLVQPDGGKPATLKDRGLEHEDLLTSEQEVTDHVADDVPSKISDLNVPQVIQEVIEGRLDAQQVLAIETSESGLNRSTLIKAMNQYIASQAGR